MLSEAGYGFFALKDADRSAYGNLEVSAWTLCVVCISDVLQMKNPGTRHCSPQCQMVLA